MTLVSRSSLVCFSSSSSRSHAGCRMSCQSATASQVYRNRYISGAGSSRPTCVHESVGGRRGASANLSSGASQLADLARLFERAGKELTDARLRNTAAQQVLEFVGGRKPRGI